MLHFSGLKAFGIILTTLAGLRLRRSRTSSPRATVKSLAARGRSGTSCSGLDLRGGVSILLEVDTNDVRKDKVKQLREDVLRVARENRLGCAAPTIRGNTVEFRVRQGVDPAPRLQKLRELSQPMRRRARHHRPAHARRGRCRRRSDPADADRAGDRRARPRRWSSSRSRSSRSVSMISGTRRAVDPAAGRRPHPGAGAGPERSAADPRHPRQDRQAGIPHGRSRRCRPSRSTPEQRPAGLRNCYRHRRGRKPEVPRSRSGCWSRARTSPTRSRASTSAPASRSSAFTLQHQSARAGLRRRRARTSASRSPSCSTTR